MSFPRYPHYVETGVEWLGHIPDHWGCEQGRRVFSQSRLPALQEDSQLSATQKYGVIPQQMFMELEDQKVVLALTGLDNFKHVEVDDFVISLRSFQGGIERCKYSGCVSPAYTVLKARQEIDPAYIEFLLKAPPFIAALQSVTDGIREGKSISFEQFGSVYLPLPSIREQSGIAVFLLDETAKIDALVAEQEQLITLLKEKRQAVISHAVTKGLDPSVPMKDSGVEWLGEVPAHWGIRQIRSVCSFITSGPRGWSERIADDGALFIQSGDLTDNLSIDFAQAKRVDVQQDAETSRTRLLGGDVVVCITGAKTGNVAVCAAVTEDAYVNQHLCLIRPTADVHPQFLGVFLKSNAGQRYFAIAQYGLKQGLSLENVKAAPVAVPPDAEQAAIFTFIGEAMAQFDHLIGEAVQSIELLRERRSALISAVVTGQIDVRGLAPAQEQAA